MNQDQLYTLAEIKSKLKRAEFPFGGITALGSARFVFDRPANCAGLAIHSGSGIRPALQEALKVSAADRYREEDPYTEMFIEALPIRVTALESRFEYDLNRPKEKAIPLTPEMAWGLEVWNRPLSTGEQEQTLAKYSEFHTLVDLVAAYLAGNAKKAYIFDLHSYCFQRENRQPWYENGKPEINLGTEAINRQVFGDEIDWLLEQCGEITLGERKLRAAENEVFKGGYLARRLSARHYDSLAVFAVEFKKIFMDEWSGELYEVDLNELIEQFSALVKRFAG